MASIVSVRVEDRYLELASPDLECFRDFFKIDSVNLLLGRNGAGKTRFLLEIARAMTAPEDDSLASVNFSRHGRSIGKQDICAIYYSALPYKRRLTRRAGLIDASPRSQKPDEMAKLFQLREVADALGINTRLTGTFGYTRNVYRAALIPALRQATEIEDRNLRMLVLEYSEAIEMVAASNHDFKIIDTKKEALLKDIEYHLDREIGNLTGNFDRCLYLTALEHLNRKTNEPYGANIASAFLNHIGLVKSRSRPEDFAKLEDLTEKTREALSSYAFPEDFHEDNRKHTFTIESTWGLFAIKRHETPIKIEWAELSSGLQALVEQFSLIGDAVAKAASQGRFSVLLLIDEGDAYLHLDWQRRYFALLNDYLGDLKRAHSLQSLQLILASHSPLLAADLPGELVTNLDSGVRMKTFAAPLEEVIAGSFESSSIGEFAAKKINAIYSRAKNSKLTPTDRIIIESVGDNAIRATLQREAHDDN